MKQFKQLREDALMEKLKASAPTAEWIHDFVHSDNPKFAGKSKKERIKMALGAAYAAKRNEEVELHPEAGKVLKHIKPEHQAKYKPDLAKSVYKGDYADRTAVLKAAKAAGHLNEEVEIEESYEEAEKHLSLANDADAKGDKTAYHYHMADHHDALSQWHESKGRSASADKHAEKADYHSDKYTQYANGVHEGILDTAKRNEEVELEEGKMDKMSLSALWHKHAQHSYGADQGYGYGSGGSERNQIAASAIENHVRKHHGNKVADDMLSHSDHHVAHAEYAGPEESKHHEMAAAKLRSKHNISGSIHGMLESTIVHEGILDTAKQVGKKVLNKLGHGSDADMRKDLQKKMGLPQTGEKPKKTNTNEAANLAQQAAIAIAIKKKKKKMMEADETLNEKFWDNEGEMVIAQCKSIADKAQKIMAMLDDESKLEAWVQAEMTTAEDAITCVHDHLTYGKDVMEEGLDEVSTNTLASYRTKADQSAHHLRLKAAMKRGSGRFPPLPGMEKDLEKHDKRIAGITTASKKLNAKGYVPPAKPNIPDNADRGYGKGRYMGDSVELDGDILDEKEVWDTPNPKKTHHKLSPQQVSRARARARAAGRPYPNLVDNMAVMKEDTVEETYKGFGSSALKLADKIRQEKLKREASQKRAQEMLGKKPEQKK